MSAPGASAGPAATSTLGRSRPALARALQALPTLLRVGLSEVVAYRAEFLVWILTTNMPLVMLALWHAAIRQLAIQWGYIAVLGFAAVRVWRAGVRRFAAFGG